MRKRRAIPVIDCSVGDRQHHIAEEYLAKTKVTQGVFLVLVGRAQAPVWDLSPNHYIQPKNPMAYVSRACAGWAKQSWRSPLLPEAARPPSWPIKCEC
jgi:hypothetical protein